MADRAASDILIASPIKIVKIEDRRSVKYSIQSLTALFGGASKL